MGLMQLVAQGAQDIYREILKSRSSRWSTEDTHLSQSNRDKLLLVQARSH